MKFTLAEIEEKFYFGEDAPAHDGFVLRAEKTAHIFEGESAYDTMVVSPLGEILFSDSYSGTIGGMAKALVCQYYNEAFIHAKRGGQPINYNPGVTTFTEWLEIHIDTPRVEDPYKQELAPPDAVFGLYRKDMEAKYGRKK